MLLPRESLFIGFRNGVVVHGTPASGQRTTDDGAGDKEQEGRVTE